jgi:hypothetical protein
VVEGATIVGVSTYWPLTNRHPRGLRLRHVHVGDAAVHHLYVLDQAGGDPMPHIHEAFTDSGASTTIWTEDSGIEQQLIRAGPSTAVFQGMENGRKIRGSVQGTACCYVFDPEDVLNGHGAAGGAAGAVACLALSCHGRRDLCGLLIARGRALRAHGALLPLDCRPKPSCRWTAAGLPLEMKIKEIHLACPVV